MNPIDEIFKKGLEGKGKTYSQSHWSEMDKLLDQKRRLRSRILTRSLYLLGFLGVIVIAVGLNMHFNKIRKDSVVVNEGESKSAYLGLENKPKPNEQENSVEVIAKELQPNNSGHMDSFRGESYRTALELSPGHNNSLDTSWPQAQDIELVSLVVEPLDTYNTDKRFDFVTETDFLPIDSIEAYNQVQLLLNNKNISMTRVEPDFSLIKSKWVMSVSPFVSYDMYDRKIEVNHVLNLKRSEKGIAQIGGGVKILVSKGPWGISSGFGRMTFMERTNYETTSLSWTYDTAIVLVKRKYIQTPRGGQVALVEKRIDSTATISPLLDCKDCEAKFSYFNVPLSVSYFVNHKRLTYFLQMGGTASFLRQAEGKYVLEDVVSADQFNPVGDLKNARQLNKVVYYLNSSIGVKRRLVNDLSVWGSLGYGYGLNSMTTGYTQRSRVQRVQIGIEYTL